MDEPTYLPITQWPEDDRPREKLVRLGPEALSDSELLAIVLGKGVRGRSAVDLAKAVLHAKKNIEGIEKASIPDLTAIKGIGTAKAAAMKAAAELAKRMAAEPARRNTVQFSCPGAVFNYFRFELRNAREERFYTLLLSTKNTLVRSVLVSKGSLSASVVHPREVLKTAISESAAAFIAVHNHPSGDPAPSAEDIEITRKLKAAAEVVGITMLDHVVIGYDAYVSIFERCREFR